MKAPGGVLRGLAKAVVERHFVAPPNGAIEECSGVDAHIEHLFKAEGLRTELNSVAVAPLRNTPLVLDRKWAPPAREARDVRPGLSFKHAVQFYCVGAARDSQSKASHKESASDPEIAPTFPESFVDASMEQRAFRGQSVINPNPLEVDESALPLAEHEVLQPREWQQIGFAVKHFGQSRSTTFTLLGTLPPSSVTA